jgi:transposase
MAAENRHLAHPPSLCALIRTTLSALDHTNARRPPADGYLAAAAGTLFARFAASLRRDYDAINAALVTPWTTSPGEGQISRLKMLKRTMYGRAGFELLRARVLKRT